MSDAIFNQCLPRNFGKSHTEGLTHKALYARLRPYGMKNETKQRIKAALLAAAILTAMALLGALEQAAGLPNH